MTKEERAAYMKRYREENLAHLKRYARRWYEKHADKLNAERRKRYHSDPEFHKYEIERHRKHKLEEEE